MIAAITHIPVIGVPIESKTLKGLDSLLSIAQMPFGIPVGTVAIGDNGAKNAALYAASIISNYDPNIERSLVKWRLAQTKKLKRHLDNDHRYIRWRSTRYDVMPSG